MPLHERDAVRQQLEDCVFAGRDLTRPVPKYRFPREERHSRWCPTS
jgi:glutamate decarboxylase